MSKLKGLNSLRSRYGYDKKSNWGIEEKYNNTTSEDKVNVRGKEQTGYADPLVRIREDKLRSLKRALYNSYQSAVIVFEKDDRQYHFRCLMNHDKLKVDYEDKVLSIPFREVPVELEGVDLPIAEKIVDTGTPGKFLDERGDPVYDADGQVIYQYRVKPGDTFKWVSGNEGYMPDSYWIIYLQYSEQIAYFRGEIRKADDEIEITTEDGQTHTYRGWTVGPNEDQAIWNVKKNVTWNDLYYTKILYITKDETTSAYFKRFDRVIINGQSWQVQGYNDNYGTTSKNSDGGIIRVALKETYTNTNEMIQKVKEEDKAAPFEIHGPSTVQTYDVVTYYVPEGSGLWTISAAAPFKIILQTENSIKLQVLQVKEKTKATLSFDEEELEITIKPF